MRTAAMKSHLPKADELEPTWHLVDAEGKVLGRLAARLATILMGKHKPTYTPHLLCGDVVVVINAAKVRLTGRKMEQLEHDYYTYYPSGRKVVPMAKLMKTKPGHVLQLAVRRMLPKNRLGRQMLARLKVFPGPEHPHQAQRPTALEVAT